jgi:hypothetical protein
MNTKAKFIILTFILVIVTTFSLQASERVVYIGSVDLQHSVYKGSNLEISFKDLITYQVSTTTTNDLGMYSLLLYKGRHEVVVKDNRGIIIFKNVLNIPTSNGLIKLQKSFKLTGMFYATANVKDFSGYTVLVEGADKHTSGYAKTIEVGSTGLFEEELQSGALNITVKDANGIIQLARAVQLDSDKSMDFIINMPTIAAPAVEEQAQATQSSNVSILFGFIRSGLLQLLTIGAVLLLIISSLKKFVKIKFV